MAPTNIIIVGAGIIGSTTAYYLSRHPSISSSTITLLEASRIGAAQGASGKAGGLVAKWAYPKELSSISFKEHVRLAEEHDGTKRWGWRWTGVGEWEGRGVAQSGDKVGNGVGATKSLEKKAGLTGDEKMRKERGLPPDLNWVDEQLTDGFSLMAPPGDTAQVHPYMFTTSMKDLAVENGVRFVQGRITRLETSCGTVTGVRYVPVGNESECEQTMGADCIILSAGAWSPTLLSSLPISATRAHSIVIKPPPSIPHDAISPYVLFTSISLPTSHSSRRSRNVTPEIYPRPDPAIYVCGPGDTRVALPSNVDDVEVDQRACQEIWEWVAETGIIKPDVIGEVEKTQACYLPTVETGGGPIIGNAPGVKGLVVAAGHTCWGICNAPGTAKAITELVMDGTIRCADLSSLDPSDFIQEGMVMC